MTWFGWSIVALVAWGLWGAFSGEAARTGTAYGLVAGAVFVEALCMLPLASQVPRSASWWLVAAGGVGALAYFAFYKALELGGPSSSVVAISSLYPALVVMWVLLKGEGVTLLQGGGVVLAIAAAVMIGLG